MSYIFESQLSQHIYEMHPVELVGNNLPASAGGVSNTGLTPGSIRSPGGGHGNPLQYSCLENPHGQRSLAGNWVADTTEQLSTEQGLVIRISFFFPLLFICIYVMLNSFPARKLFLLGYRPPPLQPPLLV